MTTISPSLPGDPERIASYRILGRLGTGGMGTVYAAVDGHGKRVAVKAVHAHQAADQQFRARFQREVQVLRRVAGPCLVPLLDSDPAAAIPWLATDFVPGPTLQQHLATHGPLTGIQLHLFAAGTAGALVAIHSAGVVHRDLKPANVILSPKGPMVLDFGIAQVADGTALTATGVVAGTPGWISPEYYTKGISGPPGDIFAWGAMLAYAATGRLPFGSGQEAAVAYRVISEEADLQGVPVELSGIIASCLVKDPARRPPAAALAQVTTELLGRQATQWLAPHQQPTTLGPPAVEQLLAEQWHRPTGDDPAWTTAVTRLRHRRTGKLLSAAVAAFAVAGLVAWAATSLGNNGLGSNGTPGGRPDPAASTKLAGAPLGAPSGSASASPALTRTQVDTIGPWTNTGAVSPGATVTGTATGSCFTGAESTGRTDAYRCSVGNNLYDPCFSPLTANPTTVMCLGSSPTRYLSVKLTQPLSGANPEPSAGSVPNPLVIVLADNDYCTLVTGGTTTLAGLRMNYDCTSKGALYGFPDRTGVLWTITYLAPGAATGVSTPIATAYQ